MTEETPIPEKDSMLDRMRECLVPEAMRVDDRGLLLMVVDSLILHLHPTKVIASTMNWTYSWGLGGLSAVLMTVLGLTGVVLQNNYTPAAPKPTLIFWKLTPTSGSTNSSETCTTGVPICSLLLRCFI